MKHKLDKETIELPLEDKYVVYFNGEPVTRLNEALIEQQGITDEGLEELKRLHQDRLQTEQFMSNTDDPKKLKVLYGEWVRNQFELQRAWGFAQDANYHPSHRLPHCSCPKLDNDERLGTPYKVVDSTCPVHGETNEILKI